MKNMGVEVVVVEIGKRAVAPLKGTNNVGPTCPHSSAHILRRSSAVRFGMPDDLQRYVYFPVQVCESTTLFIYLLLQFLGR